MGKGIISNQYFSFFRKREQPADTVANGQIDPGPKNPFANEQKQDAQPANVQQPSINKHRVTFPALGSYGRLGNQMFQIAATIGIARDNNLDPVFPKWVCKYENLEYSYYFKNPPLQDPKWNQSQYEAVYNEPAFHYVQPMLSQNMNTSLSGYFQTEKYFANHSDEIRNVFEFKDEFTSALKSKYMVDENTCAIHVRRGDYLRMTHIHPVLSNNQYYRRAMSMMPENINYLVFSDDIEWCKIYFKGMPNVRYSDEKSGIMDMMLMSTCAHFIISNSSFSWWGAWLAKNPNKIVIAPAAWFGPGVSHNDKDIVPEKWIRV